MYDWNDKSLIIVDVLFLGRSSHMHSNEWLVLHRLKRILEKSYDVVFLVKLFRANGKLAGVKIQVLEFVKRVFLSHDVQVVRLCNVSETNLVWLVWQLHSWDHVLLIGIQNENIILLQSWKGSVWPLCCKSWRSWWLIAANDRLGGIIVLCHCWVGGQFLSTFVKFCI